MPIGTKKVVVKTSKTTKSASTTPHITPKEVGITKKALTALHDDVEGAKFATDALKGNDTKEQLLTAARKRQFTNEVGAFYVDLDEGRSILVKPSTRRYPLTDAQAEKVEEIIDGAGYDAGDFYIQSHSISIDADNVHDRLGEKKYADFQAAVAALMSKFKCGDCWEMKEKVIAKSDFFDSRTSLPVDVNMDIEEVKPSTISIEAKRSI